MALRRLFKIFDYQFSPSLLGRWRINYGSDELLKQTMANHDHCGSCGAPDKISYDEIMRLNKATTNTNKKKEVINK